MDTIPDISIDHWSMLQNREGIITFFFFLYVTKKYGGKNQTNKQKDFWLCKTLLFDSWPALDHNPYYFKILCWKFYWNLTKQIAALMDCNFPVSKCNVLPHTYWRLDFIRVFTNICEKPEREKSITVNSQKNSFKLKDSIFCSWFN